MSSARPSPTTEPIPAADLGELPTERLATVAPAPEQPTPVRRLEMVVCWLIPFALVVYLGMRRGGYEEPIRGSIGMLLWLLVAAGLLAYALPRTRVSRAGWIGLGLLTAFAAWTAIGITWSESSGRSVTEVARVVTYVGAFAVALLIGGRERLRSVAGAVAAGCAVIAAVALLSRLHPQWFPADVLSQQLVGIQGRLRYPVMYWNALAGLIAIGVPLMVWAATSARSVILRGLAAAALPVMALAIYFTFSRSGAITAVIAVLAFVALSRRRLALLAPIAVIGAMSALVVWQASRRQALVDALGDSAAQAQGTEMIVVVAVASLIAGILVWAIAQGIAWRWIPQAPEAPRRAAIGLTVTALVVGIAAFVALGGPGRVGDAFDRFKDPGGLSDSSDRLSSVGGNGRWQYWESAVDAAGTAPVTGIGPGTFQFWWNENRDTSGVIRDAHSLFVETLGELGIVGLVVIGSFVLLVLGVGTRRTLTAEGERRGLLAALTAAALVFAITAGVDWLWELAVVPVAFLFVAAAILASRPEEEADSHLADDLGRQAAPVAPAGGRRRLVEPALRGAGGLVALAAIAFLFFPTAGADHLSASQLALGDGELGPALAEAESAEDLLPFSGAPPLQRAFVLEEAEQFARASAAAREATDRDPNDWEAWYVLARTQAERGGKDGAAANALRRAQELNPLNLLLNPIRCGAQGKLCASAPPPQ